VSDGPRIPLKFARGLAARLMQVWGPPAAACEVVGSVRREQPWVGDLELIAPLPEEGQPDALWDAIRATLDPLPDEPLPAMPKRPRRGNLSLFDTATMTNPANPVPPAGDGQPAQAASPIASPIGYAASGGKPGFRALSLRIRCDKWDGRPVVGVQIYRFTPANRGWVQLMRTGPGEFGKWFLTRWKRAFDIPPELPASIDGHLVFRDRKVAAAATEQELFALLGMGFIPPEKRDYFVATHIQGARTEDAP
jgi:hypothetical protein